MRIERKELLDNLKVDMNSPLIKVIIGMRRSGKSYEVDFIVNDGNKRRCIQSALAVTSEEKKEQETNSFKNINDHYKKLS